MTPTPCSIPSCGRDAVYRGWCNRHYLRWRKYGDPTKTAREWDPLVRLERDVIKRPDGCWIHTGTDVTPRGYVRWYVGGKRHLVHRWAYEQFVGPIPDGMTIDHQCRVPSCCNPAHLVPKTMRDNVLASPTAPSAVNARKTHCKRGHEFDAANTQIRPSGARQCRRCRADAENRRRKALRAAT